MKTSLSIVSRIIAQDRMGYGLHRGGYKSNDSYNKPLYEDSWPFGDRGNQADLIDRSLSRRND